MTPTPALPLTDEELKQWDDAHADQSDVGRPLAKRCEYSPTRWRVTVAQAEAALVRVREAALPLARVAAWSHLYDHNTDGLPVTILIQFPAGTTEHKLTGKDIRLFGEAYEALTSAAAKDKTI